MRLLPLLSALSVPFLCLAPAIAQQPAIDAYAQELGTVTPPSAPSAVTASFQLFGQSCGADCGSLNATGGAQRTGTLPNEYGFGFTASSAMTLIGFQLYTSTTTNAVETMTCAVYREDTTTPGRPQLTSAAQGTMTVGTAVGWYTVLLSTPLTLAANEKCWLGQYESTTILASGKTTGTAPAVPTYYRRPAGSGNWVSSVIITYPAWRLLCDDALVLSNNGVPRIGAPFSVDMRGGSANSPAVLMLGASNPNVPFACGTLYTLPIVSLSTATNANGVATVTLPVPNDPSLDSLALYTQYWTILTSPAPALAGTNAGIATVGS